MLHSRKVIKTIIWLLLLSVTLNIFCIGIYINAKTKYLSNTYVQLTNIMIRLDSISYAESAKDITYSLSDLESICEDISIELNGLDAFQLNPIGINMVNFQGFLKAAGKASHDNDFLKEDVAELLRKLSPNEELIYDEYSLIAHNPNYWLSGRRVLNLVYSFLVQYDSPTYEK